MLRLSLINSSQDSLSLHNNIKSLETSWYVWWLRFHLKKASNWHQPWIDSGQSYLFIYQLIRPSVRSFVRSFVHSFISRFVPSFTHSLARGSVMPAGIHSCVQSCMHVFIYAPFDKRVSSCRYKGNVLCRWSFLKYSKNFRSLRERFPII